MDETFCKFCFEIYYQKKQGIVPFTGNIFTSEILQARIAFGYSGFFAYFNRKQNNIKKSRLVE